MESEKFIHANGESWEGRWINPISKVKEYVGRESDKENLIDRLSKRQIEFYSTHSYLLPKGVTIAKDRFVLSMSIPNHNKLKLIHLGVFKLIDSAKDRKLEIISKLID